MVTIDLRLSQMLYITMFLSSSFHPTNFLTILQNGPLEKGNSKKIQNFPFYKLFICSVSFHLTSFLHSVPSTRYLSSLDLFSHVHSH
jgi:hypothetical protein